MNTPFLLQPPRRFAFIILSISALLFAGNASATQIVNWGGDYVGANTPLDVGTPVTGGGALTYTYSTNPVSPAGPTFYGAFSLSNGSGTGTPEFSSLQLGDNAGGDRVMVAATAGSGSLTLRGLIFFKKEDFLTGAPSGDVTFDAESSLSLNVISSGGNTRQTRAAVYALVDGEWNWYVSYTAKAGTANYEFTNLAAETWALYDIESSTAPLNNASASSGSYTFAGSSFEDIGAVGIFFNYVRNDQGSAVTLYFDSLQVNANAIPEPSSAVLLLMGAAVVFLLMRRGKSTQ